MLNPKGDITLLYEVKISNQASSIFNFLESWMEKLASALDQADNEADQEQHNEDEKQDLRDAGRTGGDATKSEQGGNKGNDEKDGGVIEHGMSPCVD